MRVGFHQNPKGGSPLIGGIQRGLAQLGHHVEGFLPGRGYDLVVVCNQVAHTQDYEYPEFPGPDQPICFLDSAEYGYFRRLPGVVQDYANAFSRASLIHDTKHTVEQKRMRRELEGRSFPYFLREFSVYVDFPEAYHPIDYPLYHLSEYHGKPNRDQFLKRPLDLFLSWGASHPWRMDITRAVRECNVSKEVHVLEEEVGGFPTPRMVQDRYFEKMLQARCGLSFDGYGSGSFRMMEVLCRGCLVMAPLTIRTREPLIDGDTCAMFHVHSAGEAFLATDVCSRLRHLKANPDEAFGIYERGFDHVHTHYTEKATAQYLLDTVMAHDWSKPTQLDIAPAPYCMTCEDDGE